MKRLLIAAIVCGSFLLSTSAFSQEGGAPPDTSKRPYTADAKAIANAGLKSRDAYKFLTYLTTVIGPRLSGSPSAQRAVDWTKYLMDSLGFQNVHTETTMVPHWVRGPKEEARILASKTRSVTPLKICALGGSIGTPKNGITAEVVEIDSWDQLKSIGDGAKGKILFFNRPMDQTKLSTFEAYGGAVDQRGRGAVEAAKVGAVAALVRSMSLRLDNVPHTGAMGYVDSIPKVPAAAVSTLGAETLSKILKAEGSATVTMNFDAETRKDTISYNVVGDIKGSEHPEQVIVIGGHLDSWDKGQGAHDDGAGVMQSIEALRIIRAAGLTPKRTIRAVMFMNEENGGRGGRCYAALDRPGEKHIAAIESDAGGFTPRGFGVSSKDSTVLPKIQSWSYLLQLIDAAEITAGGGGVDIGPLSAKGVPLIGLHPDGQRYFDYHHSDSDTIDKVNERELELGAAACAILAYVIAQEGL